MTRTQCMRQTKLLILVQVQGFMVEMLWHKELQKK